MSEEALQIAKKRKEVKGKVGKGRYTYLNAEFQRIARRDKKAFLSDQCKEIEENNRMGNTIDVFKKIRATRATYHGKMGTAAVAAKSHQLCPTLCDPIDSSPPGSSVPGILQARTLEWVAIFFSNA